MKVLVQNLAIEYRDEGVGPVMLFLHGWQDTLHTFDLLVPLLFPARRIIRVDLPGFGESETPGESWDLDGYVRFVRDFIRKLNISVDTLVGHSFGGRIVIKGEAAKELDPRRIILIASAGTVKRRTVRNAVIRALARIGKIVTSIPPLLFWREKLRARMYRLIGSDYMHAGVLKETFLKIIFEDLSASAKKMTTPALLIWGAEDTEILLSEGKSLSRLIRNSKFKVVNGAGHFVHREKPQEVTELMQEFLR
ncbi:MAG: alpha/beta hydrolase [Candidatus Sungbacteria bacterium]|uniref:Alpha/beta hydrolase n=1 Tax=Candidatus Sungiibacteriota bacterium TaxID=2750080 RepID=A0A932R0Y6_9BACT|nr:alpha/beta hydrolase [Candidatus Sungbacteria bacterium]